MGTILNSITAVAITVAQLSPAFAQDAVPVDRMARPLPARQPTTRPVNPQQPVTLPAYRPTRPPENNNNNSNNWNDNNSWNNSNNLNSDTVRCESRGYRYRECRADTRGGVRLVRVLGGQCPRGSNWGYRSDFIWVNNGCRADFQTRSGGSGNNNNNGGPSAGAVIGGVAVAAGLIALLASGNNKKDPPAPIVGQPASPPPPFTPPAGSSGRPATITASLGGVTPSARPALNTCLAEAARQIGVTGGTEIRLDRLDEIEPGNGGYRFRFNLVGVYPDETRTVPTFCRATADRVIELTFG